MVGKIEKFVQEPQAVPDVEKTDGKKGVLSMTPTPVETGMGDLVLSEPKQKAYVRTRAKEVDRKKRFKKNKNELF